MTVFFQDIDWEGHRSRIHTPNVVDKIEAKYSKFLDTEYGVDGAVSRCGNTTEQMQALDVAMQWNYSLYLTHYLDHLNQMETMRNAGEISSMSNFEIMKFSKETQTYSEQAHEIGNIAPTDVRENN